MWYKALYISNSNGRWVDILQRLEACIVAFLDVAALLKHLLAKQTGVINELLYLVMYTQIWFTSIYTKFRKWRKVISVTMTKEKRSKLLLCYKVTAVSALTQKMISSTAKQRAWSNCWHGETWHRETWYREKFLFYLSGH